MGQEFNENAWAWYNTVGCTRLTTQHDGSKEKHEAFGLSYIPEVVGTAGQVNVKEQVARQFGGDTKRI